MQTSLFLLHLAENHAMLLPVLDDLGVLVEEVHFPGVLVVGGFYVEEVAIIVLQIGRAHV